MMSFLANTVPVCVSCLPQVLATEVEQEEEYLVNTLQKRMGKLNLEKTELEKELDKLNRKVGLVRQ